MYGCVKLHEKGTVATAILPITSGEEVHYRFGGQELTVKACTDVPVYHKLALVDLKKGDVVTKYGQKIGYALQDIPKGAHVHTHNLYSTMPKEASTQEE